MYAKSGDIESSRRVFDRMPDKNEISWTVMVRGLAESGYAKESINLFEEMEKHLSPLMSSQSYQFCLLVLILVWLTKDLSTLTPWSRFII